PHRLVGLNQEAPDQVAAGEVLMARDGDELIGTVLERRQPMRHMLNEAGLAASGRAFEQDREPRLVCGLEDFNLIRDWQVVRRMMRVEMFYLGPFRSLGTSIEFLEFNRHF